MGEYMEKKKRMIMLVGSVIAVVLLFVAAVFVKSYTDKNRAEELQKEHYDSRIAYFEKDNKRYGSMDVDVAFIGDSLIEGYEVTRYYPQYVTANRGINGDTTITLEKRLKVSLYDLQPKICVMQIGLNNYEDMFSNYEKMLTEFKTKLPATKIVVMSHLPTSQDMAESNPTLVENNKKIRSLAQKYGYTYIDAYTPMLDSKTNELLEKYTYDGVHLTQKGYERLTEVVTPVIKNLINNNNFI